GGGGAQRRGGPPRAPEDGGLGSPPGAAGAPPPPPPPQHPADPPRTRFVGPRCRRVVRARPRVVSDPQERRLRSEKIARHRECGAVLRFCASPYSEPKILVRARRGKRGPRIFGTSPPPPREFCFRRGRTAPSVRRR